MVESKVLSVIKKRLRLYSKSNKSLNDQAYLQIRQDIYKSTRKYKSAPFAVIKKWIKEARADMASSKKKSPVKKPSKKAVLKPKIKQKVTKVKPSKMQDDIESSHELTEAPKISQSVRRSLDEIKSEISPSSAVLQGTASEVSVNRAPLVLDKVYLQSMSFEMASMRQALDRIGRQLDKLERELSAHRNGDD